MSIANPTAAGLAIGGNAQQSAGARGIPMVALAELGACAALLYLFRVESENLFRVFAVGFVGFLLSTLARPVWRHWVFLATSVAAGIVTIGPSATAVIASIAGALVLIARLKVSGAWRVLAAVTVLGGLAFARAFTPLRLAAFDQLGIGTFFWPIAGSIFAFRAIIFLYDTLHGVEEAPVAQQLTYFLLLPNFALPLFPIVDYRTFVQSHSPEPDRETLQSGARLMLVGFGHLMVYRLVYHYLVGDASGHPTPFKSAAFLLSFYLLYLRVAGLFHCAIGLLHFYGYRLSPTHVRHLMSRDFGEFWRCTNSYWKDFQQKFVFSPLAAALERRMKSGSLQLAVFLSLIVSWVLHSYQFFFLLGRPLLDVRDVLFWVILAFAMVVTVHRELRRRARVKLGPKPVPTLRERASSAARTAGFFVMMSVLWSFWSAPSWTEWLHAMGLGGSR